MTAAPTPSRVPPKPRTWPRTLAIWAVLLVITAIAASPFVGIDLGAGFGAVAKSWQNGVNKLLEMFQLDWRILPRTFPPLLQTIEMAIAGTAVSAIIAIPLTLWSARLTNPWTPGRGVVRLILNVIRAIPDLLYAAILVAMVGVGALPGILSLVMLDVAIIVKLVAEAVDAGQGGAIEAGRAAGGTQFQINRSLALPDMWPSFASQTLYVFELNVRVSAVLGLVGAGGLGLLIDEVRTYFHYDQLAVIILELLVVIVLLELGSSWLRRRLV